MGLIPIYVFLTSVVTNIIQAPFDFSQKRSLGPVINISFSNIFANILKFKIIKRKHVKGISGPLLLSLYIIIFDQ